MHISGKINRHPDVEKDGSHGDGMAETDISSSIHALYFLQHTVYFCLPFLYYGVYEIDLVLSICDVIVSQKTYNVE